MLASEMEIVKALSVDLGEGLVFVLTYQYHTEKDPSDPARRRTLKSASRYRYLGFVDSIENVKKRIEEIGTGANRLKPWKWPGDPSWNGSILYDKDSTGEGRRKWLGNKIKASKMLSPENGLLRMRGYEKDTEKGSPTFGKYAVFNPDAAYDVKGYSRSGGGTIDVDDFDALRRAKGQNLWKEDLKKTSRRNSPPEGPGVSAGKERPE